MKAGNLELPPLIDRLCTPRALDMWSMYAAIVQRQIGLNERVCDYLGAIGADVGIEDFKLKGPDYYRTSLIPPIRNMWYSAANIEWRWKQLKLHHKLVEPILDYGCGVGFTAVWLKEVGEHENVWGWDVPGLQQRICAEAFRMKEIEWWNEHTPNRFGTIICLNVLEHVCDPLYVLQHLREMTPNLIANCDVGEDGDHVASVDTRMAVVKELVEAGQHFGLDGPMKWEEFLAMDGLKGAYRYGT